MPAVELSGAAVAAPDQRRLPVLPFQLDAEPHVAPRRQRPEPRRVPCSGEVPGRDGVAERRARPVLGVGRDPRRHRQDCAQARQVCIHRHVPVPRIGPKFGEAARPGH
ncbi:MAG: hypothetical protein BGO49_25450 [Planctomycetales bacterium 71-10]|nr:MAG: hypothetical protein BGO49_25450 [Planctomycetales bacterium 71-10]